MTNRSPGKRGLTGHVEGREAVAVTSTGHGAAPGAGEPGAGGRAGRRLAGPEPGNRFGLTEAAIGIVAGFLLASLAASAYLEAIHKPSATDAFGAVLLSLTGLWIGLIGAVLVASRAHLPPPDAPAPPAAGPRRFSSGRLSEDFGLRLRPWPDIPLGIVVGVVGQLALVPLLELPLLPFVHNLSQKVGKPAQELTQNVHGAGLLVLALFVCIGSPFVEELFFRGLLFRALLGSTAGWSAGTTSAWSRAAGPVVSIVVTSLLFALAHFEAIQFLGLAGFGAVLAVLAWRTGRLGPGIVAHASFNAVAIVALALSR